MFLSCLNYPGAANRRARRTLPEWFHTVLVKVERRMGADVSADAMASLGSVFDGIGNSIGSAFLTGSALAAEPPDQKITQEEKAKKDAEEKSAKEEQKRLKKEAEVCTSQARLEIALCVPSRMGSSPERKTLSHAFELEVWSPRKHG